MNPWYTCPVCGKRMPRDLIRFLRHTDAHILYLKFVRARFLRELIANETAVKETIERGALCEN